MTTFHSSIPLPYTDDRLRVSLFHDDANGGAYVLTFDPVAGTHFQLHTTPQGLTMLRELLSRVTDPHRDYSGARGEAPKPAVQRAYEAIMRHIGLCVECGYEHAGPNPEFCADH